MVQNPHVVAPKKEKVAYNEVLEKHLIRYRFASSYVRH